MHPFNCFTPGMFPTTQPFNTFPGNPFGFSGQPSFFNPINSFPTAATFGGVQNTPWSNFQNSPWANFNSFGNTFGQPSMPFMNTTNPFNTINPFGGGPINPFGFNSPFNTINPSFFNPTTPASFWNSPLNTMTPWGFNPMNTLGGFPTGQFIPTPVNTYGYAGIPTGQVPFNTPYTTGLTNAGIPTPVAVNGQPIVPGVRLNGVPTQTVNGCVPTGTINPQQAIPTGLVNPTTGQPIFTTPGANFIPGFNPLATANPWFNNAQPFGGLYNPTLGYGINPFAQFVGMPYGMINPMTGVIPMPAGFVGQPGFVNPSLCREAA